MEISMDLIKALRESTGVSIMQCKKALEESNGDMDKAKAVLLEKSAAAAEKKADRELGAGTIGSYVHGNGMAGAMVTLMCETDFVSNNEEYKVLARDIAMHITAMAPEIISEADGSSVDSELVLLNQPFVKNPEKTIKDMLQEATQKFGEKVEVTNMSRFSV